MHGSLSYHRRTNNILTIESSVYSTGIATANPAFKIKESVLKFLSLKNAHCRYSLDLVKAFNCVNQEILSSKFYFYCIRGQTENVSGSI